MTRPSISSEKLREYMRRYRDGEPIDLLTAESGVPDLKRRIHRTYGDVAPKPEPKPAPVCRKGRRLDSWSEAEDAVLRRAYTLSGLARRRYLKQHLPTRSFIAAGTRACVLKITCRPRPWSEREDRTLQQVFTIKVKAKRVAALQREFPGRTVFACTTRYFLLKRQAEVQAQQEAS